ncbi:hypothetical protein PJI16_08840 [Nitrospira sp. MA-1]|nr:hypothetical protein [Nitrospira sp. MA-1]
MNQPFQAPRSSHNGALIGGITWMIRYLQTARIIKPTHRRPQHHIPFQEIQEKLSQGNQLFESPNRGIGGIRRKKTDKPLPSSKLIKKRDEKHGETGMTDEKQNAATTT